jgi:hypothetical protein
MHHTCSPSSNPPPSHACSMAAGLAHPPPRPTSMYTTSDPAACERWWMSADTCLLSQTTLMTVVPYLLPAPAYSDLYWCLCAANGHAAAQAARLEVDCLPIGKVPHTCRSAAVFK